MLIQTKNTSDRKLRWLAANAVVDGLHHELCSTDDCWRPSDDCVCLFCGVPAVDGPGGLPAAVRRLLTQRGIIVSAHATRGWFYIILSFMYIYLFIVFNFLI